MKRDVEVGDLGGRGEDFLTADDADGADGRRDGGRDGKHVRNGIYETYFLNSSSE
jgi:hypothetical protein